MRPRYSIFAALFLLVSLFGFGFLPAPHSPRLSLYETNVAQSTQVVDRSGNLKGDVLVWAAGEYLPRDSDSYRIPTRQDLDAWRQVINAMLRGALNEAATLVQALAPSYKVIRFTDTSANPPRVYHLLLEAIIVPDDILPFAETGWGVYVFDPSPARDLSISVPHIKADLHTEDEGIEALVALRARSLMLFTSHRCASNTVSPCSGSSDSCSDGRHHVSDASHGAGPSDPTISNTFQVAHEELVKMKPSTIVIQFHGNGLSACSPVMLSNGGNDYRVIPDGNISRLKQKLIALSINAKACERNPLAGDCNLCGITNLQARYINGSPTNPCQNSAPSPGGVERFIHVEQSLNVRQDPNTRQRIIQAIANTAFVNSSQQVKVTFYGYPDNDDGNPNNTGTNLIARHLQWQGQGRHINAQGEPIAGGVGTFNNPITAAARSGNNLLPLGTLVYFPQLKKYFFVEDICASCSTDKWIDLWMESNEGSNENEVIQCEFNWTGDPALLKQVWINPPPGLQVDTTPFFDTNRNVCNPVIW